MSGLPGRGSLIRSRRDTRQPRLVQPLEVFRGGEVVLIWSDVEHVWNAGARLCRVKRAGVTPLPEIRKHSRRRLFASVRANESKCALPDGGRERRPIEQPRVVISVGPGICSRRAGLHQPLQYCLIVFRRFFLGGEILLERPAQEHVGDRLTRRAWWS